MARFQTVVTELSLALGLVGAVTKEDIRDLLKSEEEINSLFQGSVIPGEIQQVLVVLESSANSKYRKLYPVVVNLLHLGNKLRVVPRFSCLFSESVLWTGGQQQAQTMSMPKDLIAGLVPISVKTNSHVIANPSPENLFRKLPSGEIETARSVDWYLQVARAEYQHLYQAVREILPQVRLPAKLEAFLSWKRKDRKAVGDLLTDKRLSPQQKKIWDAAYLPFIAKVSQESARLFSEAYGNVKKKSSLHEMIVRKFLRLDACPYLFCVADQREGVFAFEVQDITSWSHRYKLQRVESIAEERAQPATRFVLTIEDRQSKQRFTLRYHSEIRWSHGRFVSNPEAKLYKDVRWEEIPGLKKVMGWDAFVMKKLAR